MENNMENNKAKIEALVIEMLADSNKWMVEKLKIVLESGAVDISGWDEKCEPMILPKTIVAALLEREVTQYIGIGTRNEKKIRKEVRNIKYFI